MPLEHMSVAMIKHPNKDDLNGEFILVLFPAYNPQ